MVEIRECWFAMASRLRGVKDQSSWSPWDMRSLVTSNVADRFQNHVLKFFSEHLCFESRCASASESNPMETSFRTHSLPDAQGSGGSFFYSLPVVLV